MTSTLRFANLHKEYVDSYTGESVTAVGNGTAQVRATLDGVTGEAEVTVAQQITAIEVIPAAPLIAVIGATVQLQATAQDRLGTPVAVPGDFASRTVLAPDSTAVGLRCLRDEAEAEPGALP